jgi:transposase
MGHTSRGKFRGFKLHASVNQLGLPLKAIVTPGNRYDSPFLPRLIEDLEANYVLADAGYDSKTNSEAVKAIDATPVIAANSRRGKRKKIKFAKLLKNRRYVVEQFNGHLKVDVLKGCWVRPKGLVKKASMVTAGLISYDVEAIKALLLDEVSLKSVSKYWA